MARGRRLPLLLVLALLGALVAGTAAWRHDTAAGPGVHMITLRATTIGPYPMAAAIAARAGRGFVVHQDGTVDVLDITSGALLRKVRVGQFGYSTGDIAVSEGTNRVFIACDGTTGQGATVAILDARSGQVLRTTTVGVGVHDVVVDAPRGQVFVATLKGVSALDARTGAVRRTYALGTVVQRIALDAGTAHLFAATEGTDKRGLIPITGGAGAIVTMDAATGQLLHATAVGREPSAMAVDAHAGRVVVVSALDRTASVLDAGTGRVIRTVKIDGQPEGVAVDDRSGHALVAATGFMNNMGRFTSPSSVTILDTRSGNVARVVALDRAPLWSIVADAEHGRAYLPGAPTIVLDTRSGARIGAIDSLFGIPAIDPATGRAVIASPGGMMTARDPWGWLPGPLRRLPFIPLPPRPHAVPPTVSVLDMAS